MLRDYYTVTKPGIIWGNLVTVTGGYFLAAKGHISSVVLFASMLGISLIVACGCVFNNYIDRDIDQIMERTKNRVLALGLISNFNAIIYAIFLGIAGVTVLALFTNYLSVSLALLGLFVYVVVYSLWLKRYSVHSTIVGSISGAMPPVVGYCAVTNSFDLGALLLFLILSIWQMPHSFAIAIYRFTDYSKAHIAILPVKKGIFFTKVNIICYIVLYSLAALMLSVFNYTGKVYFIVMLVLNLYWVYLAVMGFKIEDNVKIWARKIFIFSIIIITSFSVLISIDYIA